MGIFDFNKKKELEEISALKSQLERYKSITDIEQEVSNKKNLLDEITKNKKKEIDEIQLNINNLNSKYQDALEIYTKLRKEINLFESKIDAIDFGIYETVFDFAKSDDYRVKQNRIIDEQKSMIKEDTAAICNTKWTVGNSESKGRAVVNRYKKLMLRAFNGECDSLVSKVKWNNVNQMKDRMQRLFDAINKLGEGFNVYLNTQYLVLKQKELLLEHEYQLKRQQEKEELRSMQEEQREEEKAKREYEQAQREAEKEEVIYQKALDKAKKEVEQVTGEKHDKLLLQIESLEKELSEARDKKERAISMAQQTKRGNIYIISNIGSFGENVYKIGLTRRLEPLDRVRELGDASVPFHFDVHAMIFSENAPALENKLHLAFANKKVNMLNNRKEFFKVSIDEIEKEVSNIGINAEFTKLPEAMEYRETLAIMDKLNNPIKPETIEEKIASEFPSSLV
ncbi:MAG: DUF4041 domain-containing protein [Ignavibacteria bacterium]|nr:DUF4041 domain-containing protein [Ignavibacteria bacterium]